ncbi:hypothetical protein GCM10025862_23630 [Arsenicicoccus piscis]|uniref:Uncharacterized protein n=1 Tax=Arsenicicoccus piscis TaxID=673954 RepID=A0ABQ6HQQ6_9MICO|nr:hypothetical protein GCM10025862_23630 [Arsenicicoccus piscis]
MPVGDGGLAERALHDRLGLGAADGGGAADRAGGDGEQGHGERGRGTGRERERGVGERLDIGSPGRIVYAG